MTLVERFKLFVDAVAARFKAQEAEIAALKAAANGGKKEYREMYIPRSDIKFSEGNNSQRNNSYDPRKSFEKNIKNDI